MANEIGQVSRAYASAHERTRVHVVRMGRSEKRALIANFNGAIPVGATIASATWRASGGAMTSMASASVTGRQTQVTITAGGSGRSTIRCDVTLSTGEVYTQAFRIEVRGEPWFSGETVPVNGPTMITVVA